jgi:hypothetical protein
MDCVGPAHFSRQISDLVSILILRRQSSEMYSTRAGREIAAASRRRKNGTGAKQFSHDAAALP